MNIRVTAQALVCSMLFSVYGAYAEQDKRSCAFMDQKVCDAIIECHRKFPSHQWSDAAEMLVQDLRENGEVAPYDCVACVVEECRRLAPQDACLKEYEKCLKNGTACVERPEDTATRKSSKKCCRCCSLTVSGNASIGGNLAVGGNETIAGNLTVNGTITGAGLNLAYGYVYNTAAQVIAVGTAVTFATNGPLLDVTHTAGSGSVTVTEAGTYMVQYMVAGVLLNQFEIFVTGVAAPSTVYGTGVGASETIGFALLTLAAGDVLTLVNTSALPITLSVNLGGGSATSLNASMLVSRIA